MITSFQLNLNFFAFVLYTINDNAILEAFVHQELCIFFLVII